MTFTSLAFVAFFLIAVAVYYMVPHRFRSMWLLLVSCYFYMAFVPKYILILFALILIDFFLAQRIETAVGRRKKTYLIISIVSNIGILFVFKYFNFFNENLSALASIIHWNYSIGALRLLLPLGLSFHTFQSLSYVIEVYRGKWKAERNLGIYALYVMFFPQLVAGPIERPYHLLPELKKSVSFEWHNVTSGVRLMLWGFFKKLVIADRLAVAVDYVYSHIGHVPGLSIVLATVFFAFQLYADFSGYSDIARGSARMLGIDIIRNFDRPYFSRSIAEFWRRWHISLSTWFRDYFYFPLALSNKKPSRTWLYVCILLTFTVTGLWHGAGWTFVIMGLLFGTYIVVGLVTKSFRDKVAKNSGLESRPKLRESIQVFIVFLLTAFTWIFFRAPNLRTAISFIGNMFTGWTISLGAYIETFVSQPFDALGFGRGDVILACAGIILLLVVEKLQGKETLTAFVDRQPVLVRSFVYSVIVLSIVVFNAYVSKQFIYFQF